MMCNYLSLYCQLQPKEHWLRKIAGYWIARPDAPEVFNSNHKFCGLYVWVSMETGRFYLGSTIDFKQRVYCHVLSVRRTPKQHVHRFMRSFGRGAFIPVPLLSCPAAVLRQVEQSCIKAMQPALNREWVPSACTRRGVSVLKNRDRKLLCQRCAARPEQRLCTVTMMPGGLVLPSLSAALAFAWKWRVLSFSVRMEAGTVHLPTRCGFGSMFDQSLVSIDGTDFQHVSLAQCSTMLTGPVAAPFVMHVHKLSALGWQLWAHDTLQGYIRQPCTIKVWYKLSQLSFVRLWTVASAWDVAKERQQLCQLVRRTCKKVHGVDLTWRPVVRLPYGLQDLHPAIQQAVQSAIEAAPGAQKCVKQHWLKSLRLVQQQGRNIGSLLANFRQWCKKFDCSPGGDAGLQPFTPKRALKKLPVVNSLVAFRGDDPLLPACLKPVVGLHVKFIPEQTLHHAACDDIVQQLLVLGKRLHVSLGVESELHDWLEQVWSDLSLQRLGTAPPGSVPVRSVLKVRNMLRGLVGVPIDKNRILYFCDALSYRERLISVFLEDCRHYKQLTKSEPELVASCLKHYHDRKWSKICGMKAEGTFGYAQCLPKDKDCSLNRPIVPNCGHPLARLFNMAARGFAYMLQQSKFTHYNLFTTQQLVVELAAMCPTVADMLASGEVTDVWLAQSDIKDMYTEIEHNDITHCVQELLQRWLATTGTRVLNVAKSGRQGVAHGYTKDPAKAASMSVQTIAEIILYELKHAYFHVGCSHIMQQIMGVSMGSKGGPALAWCVCMVNEIKFHETLGVDSRYVKIGRYFDDVLQLLLVPAEQGTSWAADHVARLQGTCYPQSLRLIRNSLGQHAEMLSCSVAFEKGVLTCVHRCKNAKYLLQGQRPRFACFVPFASAHAGRTKVMRTNAIGLMHRLYMDTLPTDVHMLLPVLQCYTMEMHSAGYPWSCLLSAFKAFLKHPKIVHSQSWRELHDRYAKMLRSVWCSKNVSNSLSPNPHPAIGAGVL